MTLHDQLRNLFLLDQQVRGLQARLHGAQTRLKTQQARLQQIQQQHQELLIQKRQVQARARSLETQVREAEERVARLREQMNSVKTNREYSALLMEVNNLKIEKGKIEEQALAELSRVDELDRQIKQVEANEQEQRRLVELAESEVQQCQSEISQQLEELLARRQAAEQSLPAEALAAFRKAADANDGEAMAAVIEENRKNREYSCGGCYMSIPAERVNALMARDEVVCCPSCGRILYLDQDLKASMGIK